MTLSADGVYRVSNSELQTFKHCRRRHYLGWHRGLEQAEKKVTGALPTGSRLHEAMEKYYVPEGQERILPLDTLQVSQQRDYAILAERNEGVVYPDEQKDWDKAVKLETAIVTGYMDWLAETGEDAYLQIVASETALEVPFDVPGVPVPVHLIGKIDVRAIRTNDGKRVFLDHKSLAQFTDFEQQAKRSEQPLHYQLLECLSSDDGTCASGALYNMLRKVLRTGTAKPPFYQRLLVEHNPHELESYSRRLRATIADMWRVTEALNGGTHHLDVSYPTPTKDCSWKCEFNQMCTLLDDGSRYEDLIADAYVSSDPLARYKDKDDN